MLVDFQNAQDLLAIEMTLGGDNAMWKPPSGLVYKLNFDAATSPSLRTSGFGAVIRNEKRWLVVKPKRWLVVKPWSLQWMPVSPI